MRGVFLILGCGLMAALLIMNPVSNPVHAGGGGEVNESLDGNTARIATKDFNRIKDGLLSQGYYDIEVVEATPPYYQVEACRDARLLAMTVDKDGRVKQREDIAACTGAETAGDYRPSGPAGQNDVNVNAPGAKVSTGRKGTHVKAPFADVKVDEDGGVRIKVPFVDLKIP